MSRMATPIDVPFALLVVVSTAVAFKFDMNSRTTASAPLSIVNGKLHGVLLHWLISCTELVSKRLLATTKVTLNMTLSLVLLPAVDSAKIGSRLDSVLLAV